MDERHLRTEKLVGQPALDRLRAARIAVVGLGGVGGMAAEALCRSGVGTLELFDGDVVSASNLNRQIIALECTVGKNKARTAADRFLQIDSQCIVQVHEMFITGENVGACFAHKPDLIVDAIDRIADKAALIAYASLNGISIISAGGAGNRIESGRIEIKDVFSVRGDPLCRALRHELRKYNVERHWIAVCETEPITAQRPPASMMFAPAAMGLAMAAHAVRMITEGENNG